MTQIKGHSPSPVDVLILGAGWTASFLIPLLTNCSISYAATTRDGRLVSGASTIQFTISLTSDWSILPKARTALLTFPTTEVGAVTTYVQAYEKVHGTGWTRWIQLGSTGVYDAVADAMTASGETSRWITRHSQIPRPAPARVESEFELLSLNNNPEPSSTAVLSLSGLWGGTRSMRNYVSKVAATKEALAARGSLHMVHGIDVARAILAFHADFTPGERWIISDGRVYDWWDLASAWGSGGEDGRLLPITGPQPQWVVELMVETDAHALPRASDSLPGKHLVSLDFWSRFGLSPWRARLDGEP